jgi:hypothetical protein
MAIGLMYANFDQERMMLLARGMQELVMRGLV